MRTKLASSDFGFGAWCRGRNSDEEGTMSDSRGVGVGLTNRANQHDNSELYTKPLRAKAGSAVYMCKGTERVWGWDRCGRRLERLWTKLRWMRRCAVRGEPPHAPSHPSRQWRMRCSCRPWAPAPYVSLLRPSGSRATLEERMR
jgi:hypothetical protein